MLFGSGADGAPTAQDWAEACDTISYEIVTRIGGRFTRRHVSDEGPGVRRGGWVGLAAAGATAAAAAVTAGVVVERRIVRKRKAGSTGADELGSLRGPAVVVRTVDGVPLHVEVDEVSPYAEAEKSQPPKGIARLRRQAEPDPTIVFVHGYALNLDCWHFQREYLRGKHRMVFYDNRSHGRSGRSDNEHATIDQLGDDLERVLREVVPDGKVVLVGHSMGGMAIMAYAERHPDDFDERVAGVALVSTTAGGLRTHRIISRLIPDSLGGQIGPRLIAGLAIAPELVDRVRRRGSNIALPGRRPVRVRRRRAGVLRRVRRQHARFDVVRGARAVLPELRHARQVRRARAVRPRPDVRHQRHQGRAHLRGPQPQDGQAHPGVDGWSSATAPATW